MSLPTTHLRDIPPMSQAELDDACRKHGRFISGLPGGLRGNLSWRDLSGLKLAARDPFALRYLALTALVMALIFGSVWRLGSV